MLKEEEDQTPPELEKNMKNLHQSLNDLLHEQHSPDNDNFVGSKLTKRVSTPLINRQRHLIVLEEKEENDSLNQSKDRNQYQYEDLDVDVVDNTDYDKDDEPVFSGDKLEQICEKKKSFGKDFIKEEIREQLNYDRKQKMKKSQESLKE